MARKKKDKDDSQQRISDKIAVLKREGKTTEQAAGEAYGMERAGRLGTHGTYYRTPHRRSRRR